MPRTCGYIPISDSVRSRLSIYRNNLPSMDAEGIERAKDYVFYTILLLFDDYFDKTVKSEKEVR